jgi:purine-binding chemotaxis protein CheW
MTSKTDNTEGAVSEFVTAMIGGQLFGLPISRVPGRVHAGTADAGAAVRPGEIAGVLNPAAAASSRWWTCAPVSACPGTTTASRRWRSVSTCAANPMAC